MTVSMSRKGNCWDHAVVESTFATIKAELFADKIPEDIHEARTMLFEYIENFYNRKRLHSSIGYMTPQEKEVLAKQAAEAASKSCPKYRGESKRRSS